MIKLLMVSGVSVQVSEDRWQRTDFRLRILDCGLRPGGGIGAYAPEGLRIETAENRRQMTRLRLTASPRHAEGRSKMQLFVMGY